MEQTNQRGVHFMMADGGFSVEGNENIQEILSKQLYLCQFICALSILRTGGNFVCKIFDIFTPFSVGLCYLLYLCFERICIHKPVTSRPANSERYIICEGARENRHIVRDYFHQINNDLNEYFRNDKSDLDVNTIVPLDILKNDKNFFNYIKDSNEKIGNIQIHNLIKIRTFAANRSLYDTRQSEMLEKCLHYWKIPDKKRECLTFEAQFEQQQQQFEKKQRNPRFIKKKVVFKPELINYRNLFNHFNYEMNNYKIKSDINSMIMSKFKDLNEDIWNENFKKCSIYDYKCTIGCGNLVLLLGCGNTIVYEMDLKSSLNCLNGFNNENYNCEDWKILDPSFSIELPRETLILAEKCVEYKGEDKRQLHSNAIHIIDAFFIEGENMIVNDGKIISFEERNKKLEIFIKSITKKSRKNLNPIRMRELIDIHQIETVLFDNFVAKKPKSRSIQLKYGIHIPMNKMHQNQFNTDTDTFVYPSGIYFFKNIQNPWSIVFSKRTKKHYYYNTDTNKSSFDLPLDSLFFSPPRYYLQNGFTWKIKSEEFEIEDQTHNNILTKTKLINYINKFL